MGKNNVSVFYNCPELPLNIAKISDLCIFCTD